MMRKCEQKTSCRPLPLRGRGKARAKHEREWGEQTDKMAPQYATWSVRMPDAAAQTAGSRKSTGVGKLPTLLGTTEKNYPFRLGKSGADEKT